MNYFIKSIILGILAIVLSVVFWQISQFVGTRISMVCWLIAEIVVCVVWAIDSTRKLVSMSKSAMWVALPISLWFLSIAVPGVLVFSAPDTDAPGPVGAFFLLCLMLLISAFVSLVFVAWVARGSKGNSLPERSGA